MVQYYFDINDFVLEKEDNDENKNILFWKQW
jgi:hypothetical protein